MAKIITFGEIMMKLSPQNYQRFLQTPIMEATFGGGEANVAVSLSCYGIKTSFVSCLPNNDIGDAAIRELKGLGVDTSNILRDGRRIGIYYCEKGASQRPSKVIYDREYSAIAEAPPKAYHWEEIFKDAEWFYFTGITPALSDNTAETVKKACIIAKERGMKVGCDLNYRKKLWSKEKAREIMSELMDYVDLCISNEDDAENIFGISAENSSVEEGIIETNSYSNVAKQLSDRFAVEKVAITLRESISASQNGWSAILYENGKTYRSKKYDIHIVDRVGGGDSFAGALLYALTTNNDNQWAIEFAVAASCLKQSIEGDFNRVKLEEVLALMNSNGNGRIQR